MPPRRFSGSRLLSTRENGGRGERRRPGSTRPTPNRPLHSYGYVRRSAWMRSGFGRVWRARRWRWRASPGSIGDVWSVEWPARGTGSVGIDSADDGGQGRYGRRCRDERVRRNGASGRHGVGARRPALHRELEPEGAASARLALHAHVSAHQRHELAADRQAEPGASVDAGGAVVALREALEEP